MRPINQRNLNLRNLSRPFVPPCRLGKRGPGDYIRRIMFDCLVLAQQMSDARAAWLPVALLLFIAVGFGVVNVAASLLIGPSRQGEAKGTTYESGMVPVGDTRRRFNVRFYLVAIMFVAFDVELVLMWPWATAFPQTLLGDPEFGTRMLIGGAIFLVLILIGYIYDIGKGVLRWD
jgi:NADH-quinone oxidoreductase subunit A